MTIICLRVPLDLLYLDGEKGTDDIICLRVPSDLLSLDGEKGADDHNLSLCAIKLDCLWMTKGRLK